MNVPALIGIVTGSVLIIIQFGGYKLPDNMTLLPTSAAIGGSIVATTAYFNQKNMDRMTVLLEEIRDMIGSSIEKRAGIVYDVTEPAGGWPELVVG